MDLSDYKKRLEQRQEIAKKTKQQATFKQHLAVETATILGDMQSIGIYMRLFNRYNHTALIECRDWVMKKGSGNKGRLFVSVYQKFLKNYIVDK